MKYTIYNCQLDDAKYEEGVNEEVLTELGTSEHVGAKAVRSPIISKIRSLIERGDTVKVTISNKYTFADFIIKSEGEAE